MGSILACEVLINIYIYNESNYQKGKPYLKMAIRKGCYKYAKLLGIAYTLENKFEKSIQYIKIDADNGSNESMATIGIYSLIGLTSQIDINDGIKYLKMSANDGNSFAQVLLAELNFSSNVMPWNVYQALYYNYLAINQGDRGGLYLLGVFYFHGIQNIPQDYEKARIYFEMCETYSSKLMPK